MPPGQRILLLLPGLVCALLLAVTGARWVHQDLAFTRVDTELSFWGRDSYRPLAATVETTGRTLEELLQAKPRHPDYLGRYARYLAWQGHWSEDISGRLAFNEQALEAQYRALQSRPAHRQGWTKMVEYASRTTGGAPMIEAARARLKALQPSSI